MRVPGIGKNPQKSPRSPPSRAVPHFPSEAPGKRAPIGPFFGSDLLELMVGCHVYFVDFCFRKGRGKKKKNYVLLEKVIFEGLRIFFKNGVATDVLGCIKSRFGVRSAPETWFVHPELATNSPEVIATFIPWSKKNGGKNDLNATKNAGSGLNGWRSFVNHTGNLDLTGWPCRSLSRVAWHRPAPGASNPFQL